jgi:uncharacterized protein YkwD
MNGARVNNGLRPVQQNGTLVSLARWRSKDQIQRDYFSHTILGTGYEVYHWYDLNGVNYKLGGAFGAGLGCGFDVGAGTLLADW